MWDQIKSDESLRSEIKLDEEEIQDALDDTSEYGLDIEFATFTRLTLENLIQDREQWNERGELVEREEKYIEISKGQINRGDTRFNLFVYDFGTVRAIF